MLHGKAASPGMEAPLAHAVGGQRVLRRYLFVASAERRWPLFRVRLF